MVKKPMTSAAMTPVWASCAREMFLMLSRAVRGLKDTEEEDGMPRRVLVRGVKVVLKVLMLLWGC